MASRAIGFLNFKFGADLKGFDRAMKKAQKNLKKFGKNIERTGKKLSTNLTLPILALGAASVKAFDQQAQAEQKLLTALDGRVGVQQRLIEQAKELQKTTLFGDEETIAAQSMLAMMGLEEAEILKLIPLIQDFAAAKGMDLVTASDLVAKSMGSSTNALSRYGIEITGAVGSNERLNTAVSALTDKFGGQAEALSKVGAGPLIQMKNQLGDMAEELGERLMPYVSKFIDFMQGLIKRFDSLTSSQKDNIVKWGLIFAAIGPVLIIVGKLSIGLASLSVAFGKLRKFLAANIWIAAATAIAAVGYAIYDTFFATEKLITAQDDLNEITKSAEGAIQGEITQIDLLTKELNAQGLTLEDKKKTLNELKKISPEYYGSLDAATMSVEDLDTATKNYTASLLKQAKAEAMKQKIVELNMELLESEEEMQKGLALMSSFAGGAELEGTEIKKKANAALEEQKQNIQDRIDALSQEYIAVKKVNEAEEQLIVTGGDLGKVSKDLNKSSEDWTKNQSKIGEAPLIWDSLAQSMSDASDQFKGIVVWQTQISEGQQLMNAGYMMFGDVLTSSLNEAIDSQESFFSIFLKNIKKAITGLLIQLAVLTVIKALMGDGTAAFSLAAMKGSLGQIMNVQLAEGGLITGPTTALIGEGIGTTASNPEVVAPLDKLKQYMNGGTQNIVVTGKLAGNDIYLSNQNAGINRKRTV